MLLAGCAPAMLQSPESYVVEPQDTLYSIAWRFNLDYRELARWNGLGADYRLTPGQSLTLKPTGLPRRAVPSPRPAAGIPQVAPPHPHQAVGTVPSAAPGSWVWPTDRGAGPRPVPGGGILLLGHLGQDVRAAAAGRVVYTGSGLRSYGQLVIIRHGETLLSAYAHNRELLVHEGQEVAPGQVIARMGDAGPQTAALYFEIRLNGRPVDPLPYLSAKK